MAVLKGAFGGTHRCSLKSCAMNCSGRAHRHNLVPTAHIYLDDISVFRRPAGEPSCKAAREKGIGPDIDGAGRLAPAGSMTYCYHVLQEV
jgi:hypothetical protein